MSTSSSATAPSSTESKTIYILRLEQDNYYVGATENIQRRLRSHRYGGGAKWTQKHPVIEVAATNENVTNWKAVEKEVTLRMMEKYGWENVRGGPWTQRNLSSPPAALDR